MTLCRQITKNGDKMIMADFALGLDEVSTRTRQSRLKDRIAKCKAANRYCIVLYCMYRLFDGVVHSFVEEGNHFFAVIYGKEVVVFFFIVAGHIHTHRFVLFFVLNIVDAVFASEQIYHTFALAFSCVE